MKSVAKLFFMISLALAGISFITTPALTREGNMKLVSVKTRTPIVLDAVAEEEWNKAESLDVKLDGLPYQPSNGYEGIKETTVKIKSMYDGEYIYFYLQYADPTQSFARFSWEKQADGSWKQLENKDSTGHENTYYEDKLGMYWEINSRGFKKKGCAVSCHMTENGMNNGIADTSAGRKYTNEMGETIDMWHWKSFHTGTLGMMDDQFLDHTNDPKQNKNWGRKGDDKLGGGYKNNHNGSKSGPAYMNSPSSEKDKYWVLPRTKTKFVDTFKTGDIVPEIEIAPFKGSRADISAKSTWKNGQWTLEIKRALITTGENTDIQDVQFSDMRKAYYFGLAVFDKTQINHLYHKGAVEFNFQ